MLPFLLYSHPSISFSRYWRSIILWGSGRISGDGQKAGAGTLLKVPLEVEVRDQNGNVLAGATVFFAVTAGGGNLSTTIATTDASGRASVSLTLGPDPLTNTTEARSGGLAPETFTAEAQATADFNADEVPGLKSNASFIGHRAPACKPPPKHTT